MISPETKTKEASDFLTRSACYFLKKPIDEKDIKHLWQHVLLKKSQELANINEAKKKEDDIKEIEAFRKTLKRQRISQAHFLGKRPFMETFKASQTYQKRAISVTNAEWRTKPVCPIATETKRREEKRVESNVGRPRSLWTQERHMKFLSAISILGYRGKISISLLTISYFCLYYNLILINPTASHPKSILSIMEDQDLTQRQVGSHLQVRIYTFILQINRCDLMKAI